MATISEALSIAVSITRRAGTGKPKKLSPGPAAPAGSARRFASCWESALLSAVNSRWPWTTSNAHRPSPLVATFHANLGMAYNGLDVLAEAVAACRRAVQLDPESADAHYQLGLVLKQLGDERRGSRLLPPSIGSAPPGSPRAQQYGSGSGGAEGSRPELIACYQQARQLAPTYSPAHVNLGHLYRQLGRLEEALACYRQALTIQPRAADIGIWRLSFEYQLRRFDAARPECPAHPATERRRRRLSTTRTVASASRKAKWRKPSPRTAGQSSLIPVCPRPIIISVRR